MCIAIYSPANARLLSATEFNESMRNNPDGMGLAYVGCGGTFRIVKSLLRGDVIYAEYQKAHKNGANCILHFRKATHGAISEENCHPFYNGDSEVYVHNGVLTFHKLPESEVDSKALSERIFRYLPEDWYDIPDVRKMVERYLGGSKVIILRLDGEVRILNDSSGHWHDNLWFSNSTYKKWVPIQAFKKPYKSYSYLYGRNDGWQDSWNYHSYGQQKKTEQMDLSFRQDQPKALPKPNADDWYKRKAIRIVSGKSVDYGSKQAILSSPPVLDTKSTFTVYYNDDDYDEYPHLFLAYDLDNVCSYCIRDDDLLDPAIEPIFLEDKDNDVLCAICNRVVFPTSPKRRGLRFDKVTGLCLTDHNFDIEDVDWNTIGF